MAIIFGESLGIRFKPEELLNKEIGQFSGVVIRSLFFGGWRNEMPITYPGDCITNDQRLRYLERSTERMRLLHNFMGKWFREGITLQEFNNGIDALNLAGEPGDIFVLPNKLKLAYPFKAQLTQVDWQRFQDWWMPTRSQLTNELNSYKTDARRNKTWVPPIEDF